MKLEVVERKPVRVTYLRHTGPYGESVGKFWRHDVAPWLADQGLIDCPRYGVTRDDPSSTPPERCRYDACVELPPGLSLPDAPEAVIPGGPYVVTLFRGTAAEIGPAWSAFQRASLGTGLHRLDTQRPPLEHYPRGASVDYRTGAFACELCLPVLAQQQR